jgi:two-component system NarL family sensor kinase
MRLDVQLRNKLVLSYLFTLLNISTLTAQSNAKFVKNTPKDIEFERLKKIIRQSTYYDSVIVFENGAKAIKLAKKRNNFSDEALVFQYYGDFMYFSRKYKEAEVYYRKSIEIAGKGNDRKHQNRIEIRLTYILSEKDLLESEKKFRILLEEALKNNYHENSIDAYNALGILYENRLILDKALSYYLKALRIADKNNLTFQQGMVLNNIGLIKMQNKQANEAKKDFEKALKITQGLDEFRLELNLTNNLGLVNREMKKFRESIIYYQENLKNAKKIGFPIGTGAAMINLGSSYYDNKEFDLAMNYCDSALQIFKKYQVEEYVGKSIILKAAILRDLNKLQEAKNQIEFIIHSHTKNTNLSNYIDALEMLSTIEAKIGNYKIAYELTHKFNLLFDSISETNNKNKIAEMQVIYGNERIESELEIEKNKNNLLKKDNELKRTRLRLILIICLAIILISIAIIYVRSDGINRKQQAEFSRKLIQNIDDERSRISKDLHDDIGQSLSIIKSKVNMFNTSRLVSLEGVDLEIGEVINQTRTISHFLHPSFLQKIGLTRSIASLVEKTQVSTGIICSIDFCSETDQIHFNYITQLYRIIQECISNTIKHSGASALKISVKKQEDNFVLIYQDNGKGIQSSINNDGIGMMTIRERVKQIQGKATIENQIKGFKLIVKF